MLCHESSCSILTKLVMRMYDTKVVPLGVNATHNQSARNMLFRVREFECLAPCIYACMQCELHTHIAATTSHQVMLSLSRERQAKY